MLAMHGPHQVAQHSTTTIASALVGSIGSPFSHLLTDSSGAGEPMSSFWAGRPCRRQVASRVKDNARMFDLRWRVIGRPRGSRTGAKARDSNWRGGRSQRWRRRRRAAMARP